MWILLLYPTGSKKWGLGGHPAQPVTSSRGFCRLWACLSGQQGWDSNLWERNLDTAPQQEFSAGLHIPKVSRASSNWDLRAVLHILATKLTFQP